jgi:hypothetical protein
MTKEVKIVDEKYTQERFNSFMFNLLCVFVFLSSILAIILFREEIKIDAIKEEQKDIVYGQQIIIDRVNEFEVSRRAANRRDSIAYAKYQAPQIKAFNEWQKEWRKRHPK